MKIAEQRAYLIHFLGLFLLIAHMQLQTLAHANTHKHPNIIQAHSNQRTVPVLFVTLC